VIRSFGDRETELVYKQQFSKRLPSDIQRRALNKLLLLDAAEDQTDLRVPPSNHLEVLRGDWHGFHSIRINRQWRVCFRFESGNAYDVQIRDYHK
jgi:proteic killer suppression protein